MTDAKHSDWAATCTFQPCGVAKRDGWSVGLPESECETMEPALATETGAFCE